MKLSPRETFHLRQVLRLKPGDSCRIFNRKGWEGLARIESVSETEGARLKVEKIFSTGSPRTGTVLKIGQALPQKGKMDDLVKKAEELGVHELWILETERTIVKMNPEAKEKARNRWERIVIEAAKQSGNPVLMQIHGPLPLKKVFEIAGAGLKPAPTQETAFIFHPDPSGRSFASMADELRNVGAGLKPAPASIFLFFGPEGGFSEREVREAESRGIRKVFLGDTILRVDTAFVGVTTAIKLMSGTGSGRTGTGAES